MRCFAADNVFASPIVYDTNAVIDVLNLSDYTTEIENYGTINEIHTNENNLIIYNYGHVGIVYNSGTAYVLQYITNASALNKIVVNKENVDADFEIWIEDAKDGIDFNKLIDVVADADKIVINRSNILIDNLEDWNNWCSGKDVELGELSKLVIKDTKTIDSGEEIKSVTDNGTNIELVNSDKVSKATLTNEGGASVINVEQEPEKSKIIDDKRSDILKEIEISKSDNGLSEALNNAKNMQEVKHIMQSSYHFNPLILMRPVKVLNRFTMTDFLINENELYGRLSASYIGSDTIKSYGLNFDVGGKYYDLYLGTSLHVNRFRYENNFNKFDGISYGIDAKVKKYIYNFWVHGIGSFSFANFKTGKIYNDNHIDKNPFGYYWYGMFDLGYDYAVVPDFVLSPFFGTGLQSYGVMNVSDTNTAVRAGGKIKWSYLTDGIKYEYSGMGGINTDGDVFGKIKVGFISDQDKAGIFVNLDVLDNEDFHYKITLNGKILF